MWETVKSPNSSAGKEDGVDIARLAQAVRYVETRNNPAQVSKAGAVGGDATSPEHRRRYGSSAARDL